MTFFLILLCSALALLYEHYRYLSAKRAEIIEVLESSVKILEEMVKNQKEIIEEYKKVNKSMNDDFCEYLNGCTEDHVFHYDPYGESLNVN